MNTDHFTGKIIAITRGIYLRVPSAYDRMDVFNIGSQQFSWWLTHQAISETRQLAEMIRALEPEFAEVSAAALQIEIDRILKANFLNQTLFNRRTLRVGPFTLFDAAVGDIKELPPGSGRRF